MAELDAGGWRGVIKRSSSFPSCAPYKFLGGMQMGHAAALATLEAWGCCH